MTVFVAINTDHHIREWIECFREAGADLPEVMRIYCVSGEVDYLLRVVVSNIAAYDQFYKKLIDLIALANVTSSFALKQINYTTALPVGVEI